MSLNTKPVITTPAVRWRSGQRIGMNIWIFGVLFVLLTALDWWIATPRTNSFNWYLTVIWSLPLPFTVVALTGAVLSRRVVPSASLGRIPQLVIFQIPTVARFDTLGALDRVVASVADAAPAHCNQWRVDIVTEATAEALSELRQRWGHHPQVRIVVVPTAYQTPQGTRFKARANHYAHEARLADNEATERVWVYHLDDDTAVGLDTVAAVAEFIDRKGGRYWLAQGVLGFPLDLTQSLWTRLADAVRPADDLSRFYFFTGWLRRPMVGLHGENLLIRADIEASIGWDFGPTVIVEDAYFGLTFARRYPGRSAFIPAFTYGASPASARDLVKQRKRWLAGLLRLMRDRQIPWRDRAYLGFSAMYWASSVAQHLFVILAIATIMGYHNTAPVWRPIVVIWGFNFAFWVWTYCQGLWLNVQISAPLWRRRVWALFPLLIVGLPLITALETVASVMGLFSVFEREVRFDVIQKLV